MREKKISFGKRQIRDKINELVEKQENMNRMEGIYENLSILQIKYARFEKIYGKMATFRKVEMIEKEKFYEIFCKTAINSHSIHTNAGDEIGLALDLGNLLIFFKLSQILNKLFFMLV